MQIEYFYSGEIKGITPQFLCIFDNEIKKKQNTKPQKRECIYVLVISNQASEVNREAVLK